MKSRKWLWTTLPLLGAFIVGVIGYNMLARAQDEPAGFVGAKGKPADPLPIKQVVLFNSGVGYFQREGEIDGNARVQLSFPVGDINDLLKSLVLQDAKGQVGTVNYDSSDPIDKILRSFALDLTTNPTFGQILNQARGEKIEITRTGDKGTTTKLAGTIIGLEVHQRVVAWSPDHATRNGVVEVEILNLNTAAGLQAIPMDQVISVRFMNQTLETEFQRALNVLAGSHDTQKKMVSVGFNGIGKRQVRVGYVVERPIWKTSYRLRIDDNEKIFLQGWALVENTSDDDWNDIRMVLVSGKPISFKMNLYDPIYIPRPFVEPEMFASLRPPVYSGSIEITEGLKALNLGGPGGGGLPGGFGGGGFTGNSPQVGGYLPQSPTPGNNATKAKKGMNMFQQEPSGNLTLGVQERQLREQNKLSYDELQRRRQEQVAQKDAAKQLGSTLTGFNFKEGIQSVATADEVGDYYQYAIDQKINLARQKSAMLPILDQTIEGKKVSIYNEAIHAKFPLLGLKLKNTSGQPLTQGPITVYDGGVFGGDTRILDLQPNEERLLSYALDQGTEVKTATKQAPSPDMIFTIGSNQLSAKYYLRQTKTYTIKNRSTHDRAVILEHPLRAEWKLTDPKKAIEQTRDLYRFQVSVAAGKTVAYDVVEDNARVDPHPFGGPSWYAVTTGINIKVETHVDQHTLVGLKIVKGFVQPTHKTRETKAYFVQNLSDIDRTFTVDHVVRPGWSRLDEKNDRTNGPEVYRFKLEIAKGKTGNQAVREERTFTETGILLKNMQETAIRNYLNSSVASADVKAGLTKALAMQAKIVETTKEIAEVKTQLEIVTTDHNRVRENLKIVPPSSEHYKAFLEKFVAQDKQIETYQGKLRELNTALAVQGREFDVFLAKLDAE
jgi:hypothetical protein